MLLHLVNHSNGNVESIWSKEIRADVRADASAAGLSTGRQLRHYAMYVTTFLALAWITVRDFNNAFCRWKPSEKSEGDSSIRASSDPNGVGFR